MLQQYDFHKRNFSVGWQLIHIDVLLDDAIKYENVSFIFYAALEARNILEKTEFDLILMSTDETQWDEVLALAKGKNGLNRGNNKYKALKFKYQSFSEALTKVIMDFSLKLYDYRASEQLQSQLADYIHIYTKTPDELKFSSDYVQRGVCIINETISFIKKYYVVQDEGYVCGLLNFNTLSKPLKDEFEKWKNSVSEDVESLYLKIKEINDTQSGGAKAVLVV
ncbi:MAG TPA: hypothetical protein VIJ57_03960 [Hanamia sp.]